MRWMTTHIDKVGESYFQHMRHAISFSLTLFTAFLCCLVHAFLPFLFEKTGSNAINDLHDRMVVNRVNLSKSKLD